MNLALAPALLAALASAGDPGAGASLSRRPADSAPASPVLESMSRSPGAPSTPAPGVPVPEDLSRSSLAPDASASGAPVLEDMYESSPAGALSRGTLRRAATVTQSPVPKAMSPGASGPEALDLSLRNRAARPAAEPLRPAITPPLATRGLDALPAEPGTPHTLYVNFDGAVLRRGCGNDSRHDCSTLADLFDGYIGPFVGTEARRVAIIESVRKDLREIGVRTTWRRPPDDPGYTMVLYGDIGAQDFAGIAPYIDCGNLWANDTCFAGAFQGSNTGATIILQEAAHTWGLEHVNSPFDNLHPFVEAPTPYFQDQCNKIVANTDLVETAGVCNLVHEMFCETGYQNSFQELLYLFGPAQPDIVAPTLELTSPVDGSYHVLPVELSLYGDVVDDLEPQFYAVEIQQDGQTLFSDEAIRVDLRLKNPPPGTYDLLVTVRDEGGNAGSDRVRFTILPEGSEDPDSTTGDSDGTGDTGDTGDTGGLSETQGCDLGVSASGPAWLVVLALGRRRRRTLAVRCTALATPPAPR
ncbi:hypothetical protein [Nannocystis punicea]|uniref:Uncharacterized protein n=1 Tax=Nannocystis punicea TaxID=2995304 RepID=A0ABY7HEL7_9BACT|nr:hypothetical protein [Nannocystis poenicansa]WAS97525.1 hypothetical protein O0S08_15375 [Nannocystis poenicansa]